MEIQWNSKEFNEIQLYSVRFTSEFRVWVQYSVQSHTNALSWRCFTRGQMWEKKNHQSVWVATWGLTSSVISKLSEPPLAHGCCPQVILILKKWSVLPKFGALQDCGLWTVLTLEVTFTFSIPEPRSLIFLAIILEGKKKCCFLLALLTFLKLELCSWCDLSLLWSSW